MLFAVVAYLPTIWKGDDPGMAMNLATTATAQTLVNQTPISHK